MTKDIEVKKQNSKIQIIQIIQIFKKKLFLNIRALNFHLLLLQRINIVEER